MRWINHLERRFGFLAVPGLIRVIVALNAIVFVLVKAQPDFINVLTLVPQRVMAGEVWRLVTYAFIPQVNLGGARSFGGISSYFWIFVYLSLLWTMGEGLEQAWGSFKLNLFYFLGLLGTAVGVLCFGGYDATGWWLNASVLFAFATLFPNFPILLYSVIPMRAKWIALISFVYLAKEFVEGDLSVKVAIVVALTNYGIFFGREWTRYWREYRRTMRRRQQFQVAQMKEVDETLHRCKICGSTEVSAPDTEFRVAADGEEYCTAHLPTRASPVS